MLRYIIKLFHNTAINKYGAQLLFTSHDLTTMRNDVFCRDEIWFACLNDNHEKLSQQLKKKRKGEYKKNRDDVFEILNPYIDAAIANAKKLAEDNEGKTPAQSAPGTEVFKIIEMLNPYLNS